MEPDEPIGDSERLGPSSVLGIASTVSDLIAILAKIYPASVFDAGIAKRMVWPFTSIHLSIPTETMFR
jgi:hypothetical protein